MTERKAEGLSPTLIAAIRKETRELMQMVGSSASFDDIWESLESIANLSGQEERKRIAEECSRRLNRHGGGGRLSDFHAWLTS